MPSRDQDEAWRLHRITVAVSAVVIPVLGPINYPNGREELDMKLEDTRYDNAETGCCARVDPAQWDQREFAWKDKPFLKDHVRAFLHVPLNYGAVMGRDQRLVEQAEAWPTEPFWLTDEVSPWGSDLLVATDRLIPNAEMVSLSGTYLTRLFEGPFSHIGKWITEMNAYVADRGRTVDHLYFFYATCPTCAKHFGANQVVVFARVRPV